ncbi:hypothetical protein M5K25_017465 [Dendrobium thyrsiflorum]|uniref:Uncharacterized protein n=1 Tax=Dendrobium thyrsiflorum TaxID=117978 RepID=A0ABD0UN33_DENTH
MDLLSTANATSVNVGLDGGIVLAEELEVDLVLVLVAFEGGEVDVIVEAAGVAGRATDARGKSAIEEAGRGSPSGAAAVVVGDVDLPGVGRVEAGIGSVVDGDLVEGCGVVDRLELGHCKIGGQGKMRIGDDQRIKQSHTPHSLYQVTIPHLGIDQPRILLPFAVQSTATAGEQLRTVGLPLPIGTNAHGCHGGLRVAEETAEEDHDFVPPPFETYGGAAWDAKGEK